jgi:hypothetical protein
MRPEVGFADLVRAIDRLRVRRSEDAHAIVDLVIPGLGAGPARKPSPAASDEGVRRRDPVSQGPPRPAARPPRSPVKPALDDDVLDRGDEIASKRDLPVRAHTSGDAASAAPIGVEGNAHSLVIDAPAPPERLWLEPMIEPGLARAIIAALLGRPVFEGPIDLAAAISVIAGGRPLRRVPRRRRRTLRFAAQLLIDDGSGMAPFAGDAADLELRVKGVVGAERVDVVRFHGAGAPIPGAGELDDPARLVQRAGQWTAYDCPAPLTPVLALTDLGLANGGLTSRETATWRGLAEVLGRTGSPLVVLTPCPPRWWPRALDGLATMVQWDRATAQVRRGVAESLRASASARLRAREPSRADAALPLARADHDFGWFAAAHPLSYALARLVALTARCEPALLRRLRRRFLPSVEAWVEGELWASPLVEVRSVSGLRLRPDVTRALLDSWRGDPQLADVAVAIESAHTGASLVVRMQERLTARVMQTDARAHAEVKRLLARLAATLVRSHGTPNPLRAWAQYTLGRWPQAKLAEIPAAFHLAMAAAPSGPALIGSGVRDASLLRAADVDEAAAGGVHYDVRSQVQLGGPRRLVRVRREREEAVFQLAERTSSAGLDLLVPDTRPVILEVYRADGEPVMITLDAEPVHVAWPDGPLVVYAIDGSGWELRPVAARQVPIAAPWSSLARLVASREPAYGYLADRRWVVVSAVGVDPTTIEPIKLVLGDVMLHAKLAAIDAELGVALLYLADDAPVEPFPAAVRDAPRTTGTYAVLLRGASHRIVPADPATLPRDLRTARAALRLREGHPGMPVIADGRVTGMLSTPLAYETRGGLQFWNVVPIEVIDRVRERQRADEVALVDIGRGIAVRPEPSWSALALAAEPILRGIELAHGYVDELARGGGQLRSAAVLWWMHHPSRCAVPHVIDQLVEATRTIERAIAIYCLEQLIATDDIDASEARRARRILSTMSRSWGDDRLAIRATALRDALATIEGPRERTNLSAVSIVPSFLDPRGIGRLGAALRGDTRVLVLAGGIDGASRLSVARRLYRSYPADLAIAWSFHGPSDDVALRQVAGELLSVPAGAELADLARATADADASVLLDRFDRIAASREQALRDLQDFVDLFASTSRGRYIVTWGGSLPHLPPRRGLECVALPSLPVEVQFREHLLTAHESPTIGKWLSELVPWGPIAAVAAVVRVVAETLPRTVPEAHQAILADYLTALRAWLDEPDGARAAAVTAAAADLPQDLERPPLLLRSVGEFLGRMMHHVEAYLRRRGADAGRPRSTSSRHDDLDMLEPIRRGMVAIAPLLSRLAPQTLQAIVRRAYLGTAYLRDDATELVFAFDSPVASRAKELERALRTLTSGDVDLASSPGDKDKLTFRASPSVYRQLGKQWRSGSLTELAGARIRWIAELNPFPTQDDPQKGHWGGLPERNGRLATATVTRINETGDWYDVRVEVEAQPGAPALRGPVRAHLHESFVEPILDVPVRKGRAVLDLVAWGSFTIGIECDRGATHLEVDLASVPNVDPEFIDDDPASEPGLEVASYGVDLPLAFGTTWTYASDASGSYRIRVVERVEHAGGVVAVKLEGAFERALPPLVPALWLLTRGDGRYYAILDDPKSPMVRLRASGDDLRDVMVTENLFLRLRARPRTSFANAFCMISVLDVRFARLSVRGYHKNAVVYDVVQTWPTGPVQLSIAPGVGVLSATGLRGHTLRLVEIAERRSPASRDQDARSRAARQPGKPKPRASMKAAARKQPPRKKQAAKRRAMKSKK